MSRTYTPDTARLAKHTPTAHATCTAPSRHSWLTSNKLGALTASCMTFYWTRKTSFNTLTHADTKRYVTSSLATYQKLTG